MKFTFENLGPVKKAELELGDLTIISGRNNTGKTSIVYALYGFLNGFDRQFSGSWGESFVENCFTRMGAGPVEEATRRLLDDGQVRWDMSAELRERERDRLVVEMAKEYSERGIFRTFNASPEQFRGASMRVDYENEFFLKTSSFRAHLDQRGRSVYWTHDEGKVIVSLVDDTPEGIRPLSPDHLKRVFVRTYLRFLLGGAFLFVQNPYIFSSARHTIPLFISELDYVRNQVVRSMQFQERESNSSPPFDYGPLENISSYPLPIHDNIDFYRRVPRLADSYRNDISEDYAGPIEDMLRGRFKVADDSVRFRSSSDDGTGFDIPLHLASSSAWELSSLHFFLKYIYDVDLDRFIIIDEPESHLDTSNQIRLAQLLAELVNAGNRVLITTHSDYIVKEVNNLIMLSSDFARKEETMKRLEYREADVLSPGRVRAYTAEGGDLIPNKVDEYGIQMPVFDQTIDDINRRARELYTRIEKEKEDE
ncbi:MAG: AAA family ATPase [Caldilineaceae bacterium]|nr:AAA family ATPase [Caldilineaceae bacterium]MDE0338830.1 AAA family ATPase [Caldilineaceae bacterium]